MSEKYGFVYLWYDTKQNRFYIGSHWGSINDGYVCSSSWLKKAYNLRPNDFKRKILSIITTDRRDTFLKEQEWLDLIKEEELGNRYYNLNKDVFYHWANDPDSTKSVKEKLSEASLNLHKDPQYREKFLAGRESLKGIPRSKEAEEKRLSSYKKTVDLRGRKKKPETLTRDSQEYRDLLSKKSQEMWDNRTEEEKTEISKKISLAQKGRPGNRLGHKNSSEHSQKIAASNRGKKRTPEQIERMAAAKRGKKQTKEQKAARSEKMKAVWAARKAGELPMPDYSK